MAIKSAQMAGVEGPTESPELLLLHDVGIQEIAVGLALFPGVELYPHLDPDRLRVEKRLESAALVVIRPDQQVAGGLDLASEALDRVHKSNMSKLGLDGTPIRRADGKVLKGPNYQPPVLNDLINP